MPFASFSCGRATTLALVPFVTPQRADLTLMHQALKLAERAIQFADTLAVLTEGYILAGRVCHADSSLQLATKYFTSAIEGQSRNAVAGIGLAQMQVKNGESYVCLPRSFTEL
jgi:hypothetical protein